MRLFIIHDERGIIHGVVTSSIEEIQIKQGSGLGLHVIEGDEVPDTELTQYLVSLHREYRILPAPFGKPSLVKRMDGLGNPQMTTRS
jgi:hypothetical protein